MCGIGFLLKTDKKIIIKPNCSLPINDNTTSECKKVISHNSLIFTLGINGRCYDKEPI